MTQQIVTITSLQESVLPPGTTDEQLITMWLHDKAKQTQEEYTHVRPGMSSAQYLRM